MAKPCPVLLDRYSGCNLPHEAVLCGEAGPQLTSLGTMRLQSGHFQAVPCRHLNVLDLEIPYGRKQWFLARGQQNFTLEDHFPQLVILLTLFWTELLPVGFHDGSFCPAHSSRLVFEGEVRCSRKLNWRTRRFATLLVRSSL